MTPASGTSGPSTTSGQTSDSGATTGTPGARPAEGLTDGQIAAVVRAVNVAEVDQAKIAVNKAKDVGVKHFAETMIAHHGQAVKDVDELDTKLNIRPTESELVTELRVSATSTETKLAENNDASFDKAYMLGQIEAHRSVLETIDARLMPAVRSEELRGLLQGLRPRVVSHLQMAQTILDTLK